MNFAPGGATAIVPCAKEAPDYRLACYSSKAAKGAKAAYDGVAGCLVKDRGALRRCR
jgi:hypothetical protein